MAVYRALSVLAAVVAAVVIADRGCVAIQGQDPYPTPDSTGVNDLLHDLVECTIPEDVTNAMRDVLLSVPPDLDPLGISGDGVALYGTSDAFATGEATGDLSNELVPDSVALELTRDGVDVGVVFAVQYQGEWLLAGAAGLACLDTVRSLAGNERLLWDARVGHGPTWIESDGALQGIPECNWGVAYAESTLGELQAVYIPCSGGDVSCGGGRLPMRSETVEPVIAAVRWAPIEKAAGALLAVALAGLVIGRRHVLGVVDRLRLDGR